MEGPLRSPLTKERNGPAIGFRAFGGPVEMSVRIRRPESANSGTDSVAIVAVPSLA